jgi:hypothetical protein
MGYAESEWERVMRVQEVMMRALSGEIHWFQAADILGVDGRPTRPRTSRLDRPPRPAAGPQRPQASF